MAETDYQRDTIMKQTGCRVSLHTASKGRQLEMHATPGVSPDARDVDILTEDYPMRFAVRGHPLLNEESLKVHQIVGQPTTEEWELNLIKSSAAPIVGIIANSFSTSEDLLSFTGPAGEATNVTLIPIIDDVLGTRARKAMKEIEMTSGVQEGLDVGEISEYLDPAKSLSKLPLDSLFLVDKPVPAALTLLIEGRTKPDAWHQNLKDRQAKGVDQAISHSLCAIHGPPGTGKSQVASRVLCCLLSMRDEKILCSAPANVALESLYYRCIKECNTLGFKNIPFVRVWSVSQTKAQYSIGDEVLKDPYHIERLRINLARKEPERWESYLKGSKILEDFGAIAVRDTQRDWNKGTAKLTRQVMARASAAFCTTAALSSPALQWNDGEKKETWGATHWLLDEAGQANPDAVLLGLVTFASTLKGLTMLGDYKQLPPFRGSDLAKKVYKTSFLELFCRRGFPVTVLNHQFRALRECMSPVNKGKHNGQGF